VVRTRSAQGAPDELPSARSCSPAQRTCRWSRTDGRTTTTSTDRAAFGAVRRPYIIDASGDIPAEPETLSEVGGAGLPGARRQGRPAGHPSARPGTEDPKPHGRADSLNPRLSSRRDDPHSLIPKKSGSANGRTGDLVVAKASLWPTLPYPCSPTRCETQSSQRQHRDMVRDGQYGAYTALGRELGRHR